MQQDGSLTAMEFTTRRGRPAVDIPACPTLGVILSIEANRLDSWFLVTLEEQLRSVLDGRAPEGGVGKDEIWADITPDRAEFTICEYKDGTAGWRDQLPTLTCLQVIERWKCHLLTVQPSGAA